MTLIVRVAALTLLLAAVLQPAERSHAFLTFLQTAAATKLEGHACYTGAGVNDDADATDTMLCSWQGLTGTIPPALGARTALAGLDLTGNALSGPVPPALGALTGLRYLRLYKNRLTGSVPPSLGNLTALIDLGLSNNGLTGPIPPALGKLTALTRLWADSNRLTGTIPPHLGNLTALTRGLDLRDNRLTGSIPPELGGATALWRLWLDQNRLTGTIPPQLGKLSDLMRLHLGRNRLAGCVPRAIALCAGSISQTHDIGCSVAAPGGPLSAPSNPGITGRCPPDGDAGDALGGKRDDDKDKDKDKGDVILEKLAARVEALAEEKKKRKRASSSSSDDGADAAGAAIAARRARALALYQAGDRARAASLWLALATEHGDADAQCWVALMFHDGNVKAGGGSSSSGRGGGDRDGDEGDTGAAMAVAFWRRAASQGSARGQFNLGLMHEQGRGGLAPDRSEARRLYALAAAQGAAPAQAALRRLEGQPETDRPPPLRAKASDRAQRSQQRSQSQQVKWRSRAPPAGGGGASAMPLRSTTKPACAPPPRCPPRPPTMMTTTTTRRSPFQTRRSSAQP